LNPNDGFGELLAIENNLRRYNADIVKKMARYFQGRHAVLEFGAGIGTLAIEWQKQTNVKPECLEIDPKRQQIIEERGFKCYASLGAAARKFDGIYSSNVLEHIEDDRGVLEELRSSMADGGVLALYVPAFRQLYSSLDRSLGHCRRYQRAELIEKTSNAGFQVIDCYYADSLGVLAWFAATWSAGHLQFYDHWIYPVSRTLDDLFPRRVAGKNLVLIAKK
jgi:SAM-dependent methyltransferase